MGEYKTIEKELLGIGQAKLQDIVFQIMDKKYAPINIVNLGGASGVQTTRKGTPDVFIQLSNGNYIFVEVTIQKRDLLGKIKTDMQKCKENANKLLEENANVEKVIFACVGKLETVEIQECQNLCKEFCLNKKTPFEFWGIDKLSAMLLHEHQSIAVSELNVKFSHGLIKTLDEYLQGNEYDVSHQYEFLFREKELEDVESKLFEKNIVLLNGIAGCGKTRLCMHLSQKLKRDGRVKEIYYVKNAYYNAFDSLCNIAGKERIVIILDDVNRLPFIKEFIAYIQDHKNIYVLATVRDYALNTIINDLKNCDFDKFLHFINISTLTREQQENIIKKIIPKASFDTLFAIHNVAHENLRFAIMMVETLRSHGYLPAKMKELMEQHFQRVNADLENAITEGGNFLYLKALVVLAFFHRIVIDEGDNNWITINVALCKLGITSDILHDAMAYWDGQEVVNISFEGKVYEIGDQILSSYLFYKLVFEEKQILLKDLFELLFPQYRKCFVDMFNSILPAYGYQNEAIMQQITQLWNEVYKIKNNNESVQFLSMFYGLLPVETLNFIKTRGIPLSEEFIDILCGFESSAYYQIAIDILLDHVDNCQPIGHIVERITEAFAIHRNSFTNNLVAQKYILTKLNERLPMSTVSKEIFLSLSRKLLDFSFHTTEVNANSMVYFTIEATPCVCLLETRTIIWEGIIKLYKNGLYKELNSLLEAFRYVPNSSEIERFKEFFDNDKKIIIPFAQTEAEKQLSFAQKIILKKLLECCCSDKNTDFKKILQTLEDKSVDFRIYSNVFTRKREERIDWKIRTSRYENIFATVNLPEDFYSYILALQSVDIDISIISAAVEAYFIYLDKYSPKFFVEYLKEFMTEFKDLGISYNAISSIIADKYNLKEFIGFIQSSFVINKELLLLELLQNLKCQDISIELYDLCIKTIEDEFCTHDSVTPRGLRLTDFIEYEKFKPGFVLKIFQLIQNSDNKNINKYRLLEDFYYCVESRQWSFKDLTIEQIETFFGDKVEPVFYEMFFTLIQSNILHISGDFLHYIASKNIEYLYRYYDFYFIHDDEFRKSDFLDIDALSRFPNVAQNMLIVYERSKNLIKYIIPVYEMEKIMLKNFDDKAFLEFAELFVEKYITELKDLGYMASYVSSLKSNWQIIFVKTLISKNIGIKLFEQINIFGHPSSWTGSDVVMYGRIIDTIDNLLKEMPITTENISYIAIIRERKAKLVEYRETARLRELSDYSSFA